jgi:hypothetical protein
VNRTFPTRLAIAALSVALSASAATAQDSPAPVAQGSAVPSGPAAAMLPTPFYHVGRLAYDSQCMSVDGHDMVLFSGAFHYFRCPKPLWPDRFRTLRAAGFNCLETYTAWNWHEQTPPKGPDDMSKLDMTDLHDWLEMATRQFGFYVVLRPGPYICAEWDGGGYPQWLPPLRPKSFTGKMWLRSDDPAYLAWCKHWYAAVAKVAVPYQVTHLPAGQPGGIVLWQIENEYDYSAQTVAVKVNQLRFLARASRDLGIDVPLLTCVTNNAAFHKDDYLRANVVQSANSYPGFNLKDLLGNMRSSMDQQPEKFRMVTELQGGWFAQVGGKLSDQQGHNAAQINQITLFAYEHGFTVTNYYMGFGGTNLGDWAAEGLTTTYDYNAPVREPGGTTDRYLAVKAIGQLVADHGPQLARSVPVGVPDMKGDVHVAVRRGAGGDYVFVRTAQRGGTRTGKMEFRTQGADPREIKFDYELGDFGAKVLFVPKNGVDPVWYPKPQEGPKRPTDLPAAITITEARRRVDTGPTIWRPVDPALDEAQAGIFNRGYVFYRAVVPAAAVALGADQRLGLSFDLSGKDQAVVSVEGKRVRHDAYGSYPVAGQTHEGSLSAVMLYDNAGRPNFGEGLEQPTGLRHGRVTASSEPPSPLGGWREHHLEAGHKPAAVAAETASDFDDGSWPAADVSADAGDLAVNESAVYRTTVTLTDAQAAEGRTLTLGSVDDEGQVYANGQLAGEGHDWSQPVHVDLTRFLHAGRNVIAVIVHNRDGSGGLCRGATLGPAGKPVEAQWSFSQDGEGALNHWFEPSLDDSRWPTVKLADPAPDEPGALLAWTRLRFELPTPKPNVWVPWRLTMDAGGDGFLYLNGHPIGRWWEAGPQHDFFLPECWLNFGSGQSNVVTVALHPTENAAAVKSAVVQPYGEQAEVR